MVSEKSKLIREVYDVVLRNSNMVNFRYHKVSNIKTHGEHSNRGTILYFTTQLFSVFSKNRTKFTTKKRDSSQLQPTMAGTHSHSNTATTDAQ